jgi:hypothetical protein
MEDAMGDILTYNPSLIDDRNEQPFRAAFVAGVGAWAIALLLVVI